MCTAESVEPDDLLMPDWAASELFVRWEREALVIGAGVDAISCADDEVSTLLVVTDVTGATLPVIDPGPNTVGGDELVHPATRTSPVAAATVTDVRHVPRDLRITPLLDRRTTARIGHPIDHRRCEHPNHLLRPGATPEHRPVDNRVARATT